MLQILSIHFPSFNFVSYCNQGEKNENRVKVTG